MGEIVLGYLGDGRFGLYGVKGMVVVVGIEVVGFVGVFVYGRG